MGTSSKGADGYRKGVDHIFGAHRDDPESLLGMTTRAGMQRATEQTGVARGKSLDQQRANDAG